MRPTAALPPRIVSELPRREAERRHARTQRSEAEYPILRAFASRIGAAFGRFRDNRDGLRSFGQLLMDQMQRRRRVFW